MYDTPVNKNPKTSCQEIGRKGHNPSTNVQIIDGMLNLDTQQQLLKSGVQHATALTLMKTFSDENVGENDSVKYFALNVPAFTAVS